MYLFPCFWIESVFDSIPKPRSLVLTDGEDRIAVGTENPGPDHALTQERLRDGFTGGGIPELCGSSPGDGQDRHAIAAHGHGIDRAPGIDSRHVHEACQPDGPPAGGSPEPW